MEPWGGYCKGGGVLGGSFFHGDLVVATQRFIIFSPKIGEDEPNLTSIFFKGVGTNHQPDSVILWDLDFKMFFIISEGRKTHYSYRWYTQDRGSLVTSDLSQDGLGLDIYLFFSYDPRCFVDSCQMTPDALLILARPNFRSVALLPFWNWEVPIVKRKPRRQDNRNKHMIPGTFKVTKVVAVRCYRCWDAEIHCCVGVIFRNYRQQRWGWFLQASSLDLGWWHTVGYLSNFMNPKRWQVFQILNIP